jgi:hypothetical protein
MVPDRKKSKEEQITVVRMAMPRVEVSIDTESTDNVNWEFTTSIQSARYPEKRE